MTDPTMTRSRADMAFSLLFADFQMFAQNIRGAT
jgi:hypothetical protein